MNISAIDAARFWAMARKGPGCWEWTGARKRTGYGHFGLKGRTQIAHRISWRMHHGEIPDDLCVLHRCDNPPCVNPEHLWLGTQADNVRDMETKGRKRAASGNRNGSRLHPESRPRGVAVAISRMTADSVREARQRYTLGGETIAGLSRSFGVGETTIRNIVKNRTWRHIS